MEKILPTSKGGEFELHDAPPPPPVAVIESNTVEQRTLPTNLGDDNNNNNEKAHSHEPERVVEWGGPNGRYGKLNVILGKGAYKVVWKAIDKEEGIEVAWNCCQTTRSEFNEFSEEVEILKKVRHPNIITFHDSWYSNGEFVFITELMTSGTLREYIKKLKTPSIKIIRRWARQILKGLVYLHSHSPPIIHRDIKCDNIFINGSHGEVKIGDMGTAKMRFGKKYTVIGTPEFMAPEMYEEKGYSEKVDIYAFGMCLLEMVTGEYPYSECKNAAQIYKKVSQGVKPECLNKVQDKDVLSIINNCLGSESERWTTKKLAENPFLIEEPEVLLISATENKTKLKLQVLFKGQEKHSIKFEYNRENDTAEDVVREMIEERILSAKYQGLVCNEIHRILRDLNKISPSSGEKLSNTTLVSSPMEVIKSEERSAQHRRVPSEYEAIGSIPLQITRSRSRPRQGTTNNTTGNEVDSDLVVLAKGVSSSLSMDNQHLGTMLSGTARRNSISNMELRTSESFDSESSSLKEYHNDHLIEDFIQDVAALVNRPIEKANEWLLKLKGQDILTVGDLRDLHEEDWARLGLTVFASRAIKNALRGKGKPAGLELMSPRVSGKISEVRKLDLNPDD